MRDASEIDIQARMATLESFRPWRETVAEQQRLFQESSTTPDPNSRKQLMARVDYLDAESEQLLARNQLMAEIADRDDRFMPLTHRLGALAGLEATKGALEPFVSKDRRGPSINGLSLFDASMRGDQVVMPSMHPLRRAEQIAQELVRISGLFEEAKHPVPVAMVWTRFGGQRRQEDVVAGQVVNTKRAFELAAPTVRVIKGAPTARFTVPTHISGVTDFVVISGDSHESKPDSRTKPLVPILGKLVGEDRDFCEANVDGLYLGQKDVAERVARARADWAY